ncbi:hypothetical protein ACHAXA_006427 [Cyclostephanos tholiformis]|uniref:Sulfotransferase domain-containing protein n=1 Tax=Cyclostephanos tholiformis TaxID=382380 RepID=A0ABD3RCR7_9STRA
MLAFIKKLGAICLGLALLIGYAGKFAPHLFLSLPFPLSIILWSTTGHDMPPYFMPDAWNVDEIDTWMKDGDLVIATGVKSGTTFMLYCTHQIRTRGTDIDDELFADVSIATPWPDLRQSRSGSWREQKGRYNTTVLPDGREMRHYWDNPTYPFRIFKSHFSPPTLPVRKRGGRRIKYLAMVRNGIDVAASAVHFFSSHTDAFRKLWGGFPPNYPDDAYGGDDPPAIVRDLLPGGNLQDLYWGYVKKWWPYRNDPNVMLLHYTDVRRDLRGHVAKLASFLEVELTEGELDAITERCGMEHMKKVNKFDYKMPLNTDVGLWDVDKDRILDEGKIFRDGGIGTGASVFSDKFVARWKKAEEDEFGHDPVMLQWAREGGEFPPVLE